jgi:hypothetical protein
MDSGRDGVSSAVGLPTRLSSRVLLAPAVAASHIAKAPFGLVVLKFNSYHIYVLSNAWSINVD